MLRRPPTQITLTAEDIASYEENRLARLAQEAAAVRQGSFAATSDLGSPEAAQRTHKAMEANDDARAAANNARTTRQSSLAAQAGNAGQGTAATTDARSRADRIGLGRQQ